MKILNITAQKPSSTGSGVFLSELVRVFAGQGHTQMVIAGVDPEDMPVFPDGVGFLPVLFHSDELPAFEQRLADALRESIHSPVTGQCDVSRISWERIGNLVLYKQ